MRTRRYSILALLVVLLTISTLGFAQPVVAGSADDNDSTSPEVGGEWVEDYSGAQSGLGNLTQTEESVDGLINKLHSNGWTTKFNYGNSLAWEKDFKKQAFGGTDYIFADAADLAVFSGHSNENGLFFGKDSHDYEMLLGTKCYWGDQDLEWVFLDGCQSVTAGNRYDWHSQSFAGLHLLCGWTGTSPDCDNMAHVADLLVDDGWWDWARNVRTSWIDGANYDGFGLELMVVGENGACGNDYIWGQGSVLSPDPVHDGSYSYWVGT